MPLKYACLFVLKKSGLLKVNHQAMATPFVNIIAEKAITP